MGKAALCSEYLLCLTPVSQQTSVAGATIPTDCAGKHRLSKQEGLAECHPHHGWQSQDPAASFSAKGSLPGRWNRLVPHIWEVVRMQFIGEYPIGRRARKMKRPHCASLILRAEGNAHIGWVMRQVEKRRLLRNGSGLRCSD